MQASALARQAEQAGSALPFSKGAASQEAACRQVRAGQAVSAGNRLLGRQAVCRVRTNWIGRFSQIGLTHWVACHAHVAIPLHVVVPAMEAVAELNQALVAGAVSKYAV